ncbi:VOC family protein [Skermanella stibiiresistens]|nr:VOC family protein [Skermanella stibiiresistens]
MTQGSPVIPCLRYRDAPAMIDWLCSAFGFERHMVVPNGEGGIAHAQLSMGGGMIMLGSSSDSDYGRLMRSPDEDGAGKSVHGGQSVYVVVDDVDAHHARARAAGAEIVIDIKDEEYGGRGYTCRDPEGHVWSFGGYDPWMG